MNNTIFLQCKILNFNIDYLSFSSDKYNFFLLKKNNIFMIIFNLNIIKLISYNSIITSKNIKMIVEIYGFNFL